MTYGTWSRLCPTIDQLPIRTTFDHTTELMDGIRRLMGAQVKMASYCDVNTLPLKVTCVPALSQCQDLIRGMVLSPEPIFLGRVGGSDTDFVIEFLSLSNVVGAREAIQRLEPRFGLVKLFNGYYDKEESTLKIQNFCEFMLQQYSLCPEMLVVGAPLLSALMPETINAQFRVETSALQPATNAFLSFIAEKQSSMTLFPYTFVENILQGHNSLFRMFSEILKNKRVLFITPFEQSIRTNFYQRDAFFPNFDYPDFALRTYNTPITYHGLPLEYYPDIDWFATLERIKNDVGDIDFDIALLSCGSYAMPLGNYIRDILKKKAIYVGGCLQLFCGIMGRRYENSFFTDQMNQKAFIRPVERESFLRHIRIESSTARDAFGAYF